MTSREQWITSSAGGVAKGGPGRARARPILSGSSITRVVGSYTVNTSTDTRQQKPILHIHNPDYA